MRMPLAAANGPGFTALRMPVVRAVAGGRCEASRESIVIVATSALELKYILVELFTYTEIILTRTWEVPA